MAIVKMDHVRLIAMTEDREEILRRLQRLGCVEIDQAVLAADQPQSGQAPPEETDSLARLREQLSRPDAQRLNAAREEQSQACLLYTSQSPRDPILSRMAAGGC